MTIRLNLVFAAAAAFLWAGAAQAQGVMTPGAVPPPPSLRDSVSPAESQGQKRRARRDSQVQADSEAETAAPRRRVRAGGAAPAPQVGGYSGRVDDRPQRAPSGGMQLEDDPRAVTPVLNNGRAGVGMRF